MADRIRNAQQYLVTKRVASEFKQALESVKLASDMHPVQQKAYMDAYQSELNNLMEEIADYEEREGE